MIFNPVVIKETSNTFTALSKEVNFYDYNGALVYSYTLSEAHELTALPPGPIHKGLIFQGWNWSLEKIKDLTIPMNIGATYITDDDKTRLKIRIWDKSRSRVPLCINQTVSNGVIIDWGDGSPTETLDGVGDVNTSHKYVKPGDYIISLKVANNCFLKLGNSSNSECVIGSYGNSGKVYCNLLREVNIGSGVSITGSGAFRGCSSLSIVTIPENVTYISNSTFRDCNSLLVVTIPENTKIDGGIFHSSDSLLVVTIPENTNIIKSYTFINCYSLASVTIPNSVTTIEAGAFGSCYSLASVTIPNSVTTIEAGAFQNCYGMAEYYLKSTTPPELLNSNVFSNIPSDCIIYVPKGYLEVYKNATNWSTYTSHMQEEPV